MSAANYELFQDGSDAALSGNGGSITNTQTSFTLASVTGLPTGPNFRILIGSEIILVTGYASGTVTSCTRGVEGTTAIGHNDGDVVKHVLTKGSMLQMITDAHRYDVVANLPTSAPAVGYKYRCTDSYYEYIWNGTSWDAWFRDQRAYPPTGSWVWKAQNANALLDVSKNFYRLYNTTPTSPVSSNVYWKLTPATPYKVHIKFRFFPGTTGASTSVGEETGFFLGRDSDGFGTMYSIRSSGDLICYTVTAGSNNFTSIYEPSSGICPGPFADGICNLAIEDDGTTKKYGIHDGNGNIVSLFTRTHTQDTTPDHIGFYFDGTSAGIRDLISWREF